MNLNATSRPLPPLTLSAKYRFYDYEDWSDQITFPALVETDTTLERAARRETLTVTPTVSYIYDDHISSTLGLQQATSWSAGMDFTWAPFERLSLYGGYMHESISQKQRQRARPVRTIAGEPTALDFPDFDWISNNTDTIETAHAGLRAVLIPNVLDWSLGASYEYAHGTVKTRNPVAPTSRTAAENFTATAKRWPAFTDELIRLETALAYHFLKSWTAKLGYVFESFQKHDWRTDTLNPFIPAAGNGIWLGNDLKGYTAHIIAATIGYRFR